MTKHKILTLFTPVCMLGVFGVSASIGLSSCGNKIDFTQIQLDSDSSETTKYIRCYFSHTLNDPKFVIVPTETGVSLAGWSKAKTMDRYDLELTNVTANDTVQVNVTSKDTISPDFKVIDIFFAG